MSHNHKPISYKLFLKALVGNLEYRKIGNFILRKGKAENDGITVHIKKTLKIQEETENRLKDSTDKECKKKEWLKSSKKMENEFLKFSKLPPDPINNDELSMIE